ncbi:MAG: ribonuclease H-like domain-containing protein [Nitrososphaerales archaeon]
MVAYELTGVPLIGWRRAMVLQRLGIKSVSELAQRDPSKLASLHEIKACDGSFSAQIRLIINFARAIKLGKPIVVGIEEFITKPSDSIYFLDLEYDPNTPIFIFGVMDLKGRITQSFLDQPNDRERLIHDFAEWIASEKPTFVTYASKAADEPILYKSFNALAISTNILKSIRFYDLFYDVIFPTSVGRQKIFLPIKPLTMKTVSDYFGYNEPHSLRICNGFAALSAYHEYLKSRRKELRDQLLFYNQCELERIRMIFEKLSEVFNKSIESREVKYCENES